MQRVDPKYIFLRVGDGRSALKRANRLTEING